MPPKRATRSSSAAARAGAVRQRVWRRCEASSRRRGAAGRRGAVVQHGQVPTAGRGLLADLVDDIAELRLVQERCFDLAREHAFDVDDIGHLHHLAPEIPALERAVAVNPRRGARAVARGAAQLASTIGELLASPSANFNQFIFSPMMQ
jgi:hypothetical protein